MRLSPGGVHNNYNVDSHAQGSHMQTHTSTKNKNKTGKGRKGIFFLISFFHTNTADMNPLTRSLTVKMPLQFEY